jgi:phosphatidylserine/phosphatidylglycerophosphate/cardiolipin synthase-like enzyme
VKGSRTAAAVCLALVAALCVLVAPAASASAAGRERAATTRDAATARVVTAKAGSQKATAQPATTQKRTVTRATTQQAAPRATVGSYSPRTGMIVNNPRARSTRWVIRGHVLRTINSVPGGHKIRIASWNFNSRALLDALVRADRRGVSVRLLMADNMVRQESPQGSFHKLRRALQANALRRKRAGRPPRPPGMKSWARTCRSSCRGRSGIMHSKIYLFSKAGRSRQVVMASSANATDFAATLQWNDIYTVVNRPTTYAAWIKVFSEMAADRRARPAPYRVVADGPNLSSIFFPWQPRRGADPVLRRLAPIKCKGANDGAGVNGRTKIRIAQTAILDDRGLRIALRLRQLWNQGCNVRIVYAVAKDKVKVPLRNASRGPVPMREITQDTDGDGVYDKYLHMKVLTVSGVYGSDRSAHITWNGSENWTAVAANSDEAGFRVFGTGLERRYSRWIDRLFANPPRSAARNYALFRSEPVDPYAKVEIY